ncbi:MAG: hypothetical protein ACT4OY_08630 [Alphaproteobacteria bacterium]
MTQKNIEHQTRAQIVEMMPRAIEIVMLSYQVFLDNEKMPKATKEFREHHNACKVALGHVALLLKLAKWADVSGESDEEKRKAREDMMENAEKELKDRGED